MDKKFHLVDGEPKPCTASIRDCPVGGSHFATEAEARASYDHENHNKLFRSFNKYTAPYDNKDTTGYSQFNRTSTYHSNKGGGITSGTIAVATSVGVVAALGIVGGMAYQINGDMNHAASKAVSTPYSITLNSTGTNGNGTYSAKLVDANLKQTSFAKCSFDKDYTKEKPIVCKSADGKFTVNIQNHSIKRVVDGASLTVKNSNGTSNTINNYKISGGGAKYILIPNGSFTK